MVQVLGRWFGVMILLAGAQTALASPSQPSADPQVHSITARLQSPLPQSDISSEFGDRHHPTLRYARFHGGVDYAAKQGTPVLAAGDGFIQKIERSKGHGLMVLIRHDGSLTSGYAHLSSARKGLKAGQRVRAGERIGKVGRSGRASGPHLHFEVLMDGVRVDPRIALAAPVEPQMQLVALRQPLQFSSALGTF